MSEEIKDIGSFFQQSFNDYRIDSGINEWALMKKKLFWQNFFKLSVHTFNVYYATIAVAASVFISAELYTYLNKEDFPQENTMPVIIQEQESKIQIIEEIDSVDQITAPEPKPQQDSFSNTKEFIDFQKKELPEENSNNSEDNSLPDKMFTDTIETQKIIEKNIEPVIKEAISVDSVEEKPTYHNPDLKKRDSVVKVKNIPEQDEKKEVVKDSVVKVKKEVKIQVSPQEMREIRKKKRQQKKQNKKSN